MVSIRKGRVDIVRVYEDPGRYGGEHRVLADRLWPRGVRKDAIDYDEWIKDATPSSELRRWYGHDPARFTKFSERYRSELAMPPAREVVAHLREVAVRHRLVLLTATRDIEHSGAAVLCDVIRKRDREQ